MTVTGCRCCCWNRYGRRREGRLRARGQIIFCITKPPSSLSLVGSSSLPLFVRSFRNGRARDFISFVDQPRFKGGKQGRKEGSSTPKDAIISLQSLSLSLSLSLSTRMVNKLGSRFRVRAEISRNLGSIFFTHIALPTYPLSCYGRPLALWSSTLAS